MHARRRDLLRQSVAFGAAALVGRTALAQTPQSAAPAGAGLPEPSGRADFDFFLGRWSVSARRLRHRLTGDQTWEPVTGTTRVFPILQGAGNMDEDAFQLSGGVYVGGMLRLFDAKQNLWTTYGLDRDGGAVQPPVSGRFQGGRGEFFGDDADNGRPIKVRHLYFNKTPTTCRWEQAFSTDGGKVWETNWIIDFTRMAAAGG